MKHDFRSFSSEYSNVFEDFANIYIEVKQLWERCLSLSLSFLIWMQPDNPHIADLLPFVLDKDPAWVTMSSPTDNWFIYFWAANEFFKVTKGLDL